MFKTYSEVEEEAKEYSQKYNIPCVVVAYPYSVRTLRYVPNDEDKKTEVYDFRVFGHKEKFSTEWRKDEHYRHYRLVDIVYKENEREEA